MHKKCEHKSFVVIWNFIIAENIFLRSHIIEFETEKETQHKRGNFIFCLLIYQCFPEIVESNLKSSSRPELNDRAELFVQSLNQIENR